MWAWPGNVGVSAYLPGLTVPIEILVMALSMLVVARTHENRSLAWVLAAGILVAPYAGPLAALPLLLTLPILRPWPRLYVIAALQPLAAWTVALAGLLAMLLTPLFVVVQQEDGKVSEEPSLTFEAGELAMPLDARSAVPDLVGTGSSTATPRAR